MLKNIYRDMYLFYSKNTVSDSQDSTFLPNISEAHGFIFCESGEFSANVEGVSYSIGPGDLLIYREAEVHKVWVVTFPAVFHQMSFSPYYYRIFDTNNRICRPFTDRPLGVGNHIPAGTFNTELFKNCFSCIAAVPDVYMRRLSVIGALTMILSELNRIYDFDALSSKEGQPPMLRDIISSVEEHLDNLTPETIAASLYISRSQMDRIFKKHFGFTLWKYITFKRLIKARHLLHSGIANSEVAKLCGFGDYSTFYKVYIKVFNHPPKAAQPTDTIDPLLRQFYQFDEFCSLMDNPGDIERFSRHILRFTL